MASTLERINVGLLVAGGLCCAGVLVWLFHSGRWRNPLAGVPLPQGGPTIFSVVVVILVYFALAKIAILVAELGGSPATAAIPGSTAWHRATLMEQGTALLVFGLMVVMLAQARRANPGRFSLGRATGVAAGIVGLLVLLPLTALQSEMGRIVWNWLHPETAPPVHAVLQALSQSQWGTWGTVQLVVGAVLIAPLTEELFFRGLLLQALCYHFRHGWLAVAVSAVTFGLVHAQPQDVLPLLTMGVVLGYLRLRCGVLWPCILLHALFNARTMAFVVLAPELLNNAP
jgi:membrane protease YdiL (CAAX protease family)